MSKRIDREEQRLMTMLTDANAQLHVELARLMRAAGRVQKVRKQLRSIGYRLAKRRHVLAVQKQSEELNRKDGGQ